MEGAAAIPKPERRHSNSHPSYPFSPSIHPFHPTQHTQPQIATVLSASGIERQMAGEQGSKLDAYDLEVAAEREDVLRDLAEFQLAAVRRRGGVGLGMGAGGEMREGAGGSGGGSGRRDLDREKRGVRIRPS